MEERKDLCESFGLTAKLLLFLHWRGVGKHVAVTPREMVCNCKSQGVSTAGQECKHSGSRVLVNRGRMSAQWRQGVSTVRQGC